MATKAVNVDYKISSAIMLIYDIPPEKRSKKDKLILERHFNDMYAVFTHKLSAFALEANPSKEEIERLRGFLDELIKARELLEE